jgi:hypothetical protein
VNIAAQWLGIIDEGEDRSIVELIVVQVAQRRTGARAKGVQQFESAALGDIDDTLEHASGVLRSVGVEDASTPALAKDASTFAF